MAPVAEGLFSLELGIVVEDDAFFKGEVIGEAKRLVLAGAADVRPDVVIAAADTADQ